MWLRLSQITDFACVNEFLTEYQLHDGQQRLDEARMFRAVRRVLGKYPLELARRPLLLWWLLWSGAFSASIPAYKRAQSGDFGAVFGGATGASARASESAVDRAGSAKSGAARIVAGVDL